MKKCESCGATEEELEEYNLRLNPTEDKDILICDECIFKVL